MSGLMENEIAQTLDIAADKTQYDAAARKLVAQKAILAYILKSAMDITADDKKRVLSEEFNIAVTDSIEQEVERMCNLSDGLEQRCMARGFAKGQAAGRAEGRTEGAMETLFSLVKKGLLTVSAAAQQAEMATPEFEQKYRMFYNKCSQ